MKLRLWVDDSHPQGYLPGYCTSFTWQDRQDVSYRERLRRIPASEEVLNRA